MLAFRLIGVILIVFVCSATGFLKGLSVKMRCKKLSLFCGGLDTLYEYIEQGEFGLNDAIKRAFVKCGFITFYGGEYVCRDSDLNREDKVLITEFFASLGHSVKKVECDRIKSFSSNIKKLLKEAESETVQKSKIYQTLGVCVGLTLGILLV